MPNTILKHLTFVFLCSSVACSKPVAEPTTTVTPEPKAATSAVAANCNEESENCGEHEAAAATETVFHGTAGAALSGLELVDVAELIANPDKYRGQKIAVKGPVKAMCHHKRSWFAIGDEGKAIVRVITGPDFLVPMGIMHTTGTAEGTVEVIAVSPQRADHFAKDHNIGDPVQSADMVKQVILRASGAKFE